jgi:hypothetical protein
MLANIVIDVSAYFLSNGFSGAMTYARITLTFSIISPISVKFQTLGDLVLVIDDPLCSEPLSWSKVPRTMAEV